MTTGNAPPLEFLIEQLQECAKPYSGLYAADLMNQAADSLKELQSIRSAELPVEPRRSDQCGIHYVHQPHDYCNGTAAPLIPDEELISRGYVTGLQSALQLAQEEKIFAETMLKDYRGAFTMQQERAEKAESINRRMVELMKRPPDEYLNISDIWSQSCDDVEGCYLGHPTQQHYFADLLHKAMSAELLKEAEK